MARSISRLPRYTPRHSSQCGPGISQSNSYRFARPYSSNHSGIATAAINIKREGPERGLDNNNVFVLEGYHTIPPHDWLPRVQASTGTYSQQSQPVPSAAQMSDRSQRLPQATAPRSIRKSVYAAMSSSAGQDYYEGFPVPNGTYIHADARQADEEAPRFQAYAENPNHNHVRVYPSLASRHHLNSIPQNCDVLRHAISDHRSFTHSSSFQHDYHQNDIYHPNPDTMSLSFESRSFMPESSYPNMMHEHQEQEEMQHEHTRYPSPPPPLSENPYNPQTLESPSEDVMDNLPSLPSHHGSDAPSPGRSKPIPKPHREVIKGENGRFSCTWVGCTEEVRDFARKCEWSKHMDKHDRPYKCPADGCEKLPGFTYSGGLLRHEREVHGKHGGPRKQLNCPHPNCKRYTGKGFSRQENLNEHLRRVHTDGGAQDGEATEEEHEEQKAGQKRKRAATAGRDDVREELKRLRAENEDLKRNLDIQTQQTNKMMSQIAQLQQNQAQAQLQASLQQHNRMPQANML